MIDLVLVHGYEYDDILLNDSVTIYKNVTNTTEKITQYKLLSKYQRYYNGACVLNIK